MAEAPKPPRPPHRDVLRSHTPPVGVQAQIAAPVGTIDSTVPGEEPSSWAGDTGVGERNEETPVGLQQLDAEAEQRLRNRVKETNTTTQDILRDVQDAHSKIDQLGDRVVEVEHRVTEHTLATVKAVGEFKADVKGTLGRLEGQVGELIKVVDDKRERQLVTFEAHVEIDKAAKVTAIEDEASAREHRRKDDAAEKQATRDRWGKILQIIGALVGLATAAFAAGRC